MDRFDGQRIRDARQAQRLSQQELADLSGISLRTIQRLEKGISSPRPYTLRKLEGVLSPLEPPHIPISSDPLWSYLLIQWTGILCPFLFAFWGYRFWRKNTWPPEAIPYMSRLVSLSLLVAIGIPALTGLSTLIIRSLGGAVAWGYVPTPLALYGLFMLVYAGTVTRLIGGLKQNRHLPFRLLPAFWMN